MKHAVASARCRGLFGLAGASAIAFTVSCSSDSGELGQLIAIENDASADRKSNSSERSDATSNTNTDESSQSAQSSPSQTNPPAGADASSPVTTLSCSTIAPPRGSLLAWGKAGVGLKMEGARVIGWADQSGGGDFVPTRERPTVSPDKLNNQAVLHFEGRNEALSRDVPIDGLEGLTLAIVNRTPTLWKDSPDEWCHHARCDAQGTPAGSGMRVTTETGCSGTYQHMFWWDGKKNGDRYVDWSGAYLSPKQEEVSFRFGTGDTTYSPNPCDLKHDPLVAWPRPTSIAAAFTMTIAIHAGAVNRLYVQGEKVSETPSPGGKTRIISGNRMDVGNGFGGLEGTNRGGDIAEFLVYGAALSDSDRTTLERYLQCRFFPDKVQ